MTKSALHGAISEFLFWFHLCFIVCAVLSGLVLPLLVVVAAVVAHRLHTLAFDGCVLTAIQKRVGLFPHDRTFLQIASDRLFGRPLSARQSTRLDLGFAASCLTLAVARHVLTNF
jgi:hypothetical protein